MPELHTVELGFHTSSTLQSDLPGAEHADGFWRAALPHLKMLSRLGRMKVIIRADRHLVLTRSILRPKYPCTFKMLPFEMVLLPFMQIFILTSFDLVKHVKNLL